MKKLEFSQAISILANLGVIAGIIFLAVEIQQNNALLQAQAGIVLVQNRLTNNDLLRTDPEFAQLMAKLESGAELDAAERWQEHGFYQSFLIRWSWEYSEYLAGRLTRDQLPAEVWGRLMCGIGPLPTPRFTDTWEQMRYQYDPEFVEFLDEEVIPAVCK